MEIVRNDKLKFVEVWLTNEEQQAVDRNKMANDFCSQLPPKYKIVFFLSGKDDLLDCTKQLLKHNLYN